MINNDNEAYKKVKQVGLESLNKNNEMVIINNLTCHQFTKAFTKSYTPDKCIECIFHGTTLSEKIMRVIRTNGDITPQVNREVSI